MNLLETSNRHDALCGIDFITCIGVKRVKFNIRYLWIADDVSLKLRDVN